LHGKPSFFPFYSSKRKTWEIASILPASAFEMKARPRRRNFALFVQAGRLLKAPIKWSKAGNPTMKPPIPATLADLDTEAERMGETPGQLLDRLRGADRQWQLDHAADYPAGKN
jgi:hypothetical protein